MIDLATAQHSPLGYCIYCGAVEDLTREHILPRALGGASTLPDASCQSCAKVTGALEQAVLRGPMWAVRAFRDFPSRTKHVDAPKSIRITLTKDGREMDVDLPIEEAPLLIQFPLFLKPGLLRSEEYQKGIDVRGTANVVFGERPDELCRRLGASKISITQQYKYVEFARMLAKFAYCGAVADGAVEHILERPPPVVRAILGRSNDIGRFVGNIDDGGRTRTGFLHHMVTTRDESTGQLLADIQLFADSQAPRYGVFLGNLRNPP